ncbi:MAG TPA: hypothetical protein PLY16_02960 [Candidatus Saccharibacteria bacterium]|nr:hypothetical protein [Candidatus Saccharibacteria bacterium]
MAFFVSATTAPSPKTTNSKTIAIAYAALLTTFAVTQLFWFENLPTLFESFGFEPVLAVLSAALIVSLEVLAIPFLLRMRLSPAFRYLSMACGWLVAIFWISVSLYVMISGAHVSTIGFLGSEIPITPGWWAVFMSFALLVMATWASWGLWPGKARVK